MSNHMGANLVYSSALRILVVLLKMLGNDDLCLLTVSPFLYPLRDFHLKK